MPGNSNSYSFYCSDEQPVQKAEQLVEEGEFRNFSHAVSFALREAFGEGGRGSTDEDEVTVRVDDTELVNYIRQKHEDGEFYNQNHVVQVALLRMKENDKGQNLV